MTNAAAATAAAAPHQLKWQTDRQTAVVAETAHVNAPRRATALYLDRIARGGLY